MFKINHYNSCNTLQLEQLLEHMNNSLRFEIRFKNILEAIMYLPKKKSKIKKLGEFYEYNNINSKTKTTQLV